MDFLKRNVENKMVWIVAGVLVFGLLLGYCAGKKGSERRAYWIGADDRGGHMRMMDEKGGMHMMMGGMMQGLEGKKGAAMEQAFLEEMIVHHEGAVAMAEALLKETKRPELVTLGTAIVIAQTEEIAQMKAWLAEWFPKN